MRHSPSTIKYVVALSLIAPARASASVDTTIIRTSFEAAEDPAYALGTINGQNIWSIVGGTAMVTDTAGAASDGVRGLRFTGSSVALDVRHTPYVGSAAGVQGIVYFDADVKLTSSASKDFTIVGYDLYGLSAKRTFAVEWSLPVNDTGSVRCYTGSSRARVAGYRLGEWSRITVKIDHATGTYQVSVNAGPPLTAQFRESYTPTASGTRPAGVKEYHQVRFNLGGGTSVSSVGSVDAALDRLVISTLPPEGVTFPAPAVTYTVTVQTPTAGSIALAPTGPTYAEGTPVTATLTLPSGYVNRGWTGSLSGTELVKTFSVDSNMTIGADVRVDTTNPPRPGRRFVVASAADFKTAVGAALPGDTVELVNGVYNLGTVTMTRAGTASASILLRAQSIGGVELNGTSAFVFRTTAHVVLEGFLFTGGPSTAVKTESSSYIRITRNTFRLAEPNSSSKWVLIGGKEDLPQPESHHNRIDHDLFDGKDSLGNYITIDGSQGAGGAPYLQSQHDRIDRNHFRNIGPRATNEKEAIRIGWSAMSMSSGFTTLEENLFENCDGDPEIVSVKSCDNVIRANTFLTSQGTLSLRHGNRNRVEGNFFLGGGRAGTGGIRVYGQDHVIVNNYLEGLTGTGFDAPLQLDGGDVDQSGSLTSHWRVYRAVAAFNTFVNNASGIEVGKNYSLAPVGCVVANNIVTGSSGSLISHWKTPVDHAYSGNIVWPTGSATVGVMLPDTSIRLVDPSLISDGEVWRVAPGSPAVDGARGWSDIVGTDIDGQTRMDPKDVGADEYVAGSAMTRPLTIVDVGPFAIDLYTGVADPFEPDLVPVALEILPCYPNPFNPETKVGWRMKERGWVKVAVYDLLGRKVAMLLNDVRPAGESWVTWTASGASSGAYVVRVEAGGLVLTQRVALIK